MTELTAHGHDVTVIHRGTSEPEPLSSIQHIHVDRQDSAALHDVLQRTGMDALVDMYALTRDDANSVVSSLPGRIRLLVLSSMDVYQAYGALLRAEATEPVPLDETSPVRSERYPYRGKGAGMDDYEKLDVEEVYCSAGSTIIRLPMVYGEHDYQRREDFILRRVRAGRSRIPIGTGNWLWSRGYVGDMARGIRLALESSDAAGQVLNLSETSTATMCMWAQQILDAAGSTAELVRVPDDVLPDDLKLTGAVSQHLLVDSARARALLGWSASDVRGAVHRSVTWHIENPPVNPSFDVEQDDRALANAI